MFIPAYNCHFIGNLSHPLMNMSGWWFGTFFIFHNIWVAILPIDELIFFRGFQTTNQMCFCSPSLRSSRRGWKSMSANSLSVAEIFAAKAIKIPQLAQHQQQISPHFLACCIKHMIIQYIHVCFLEYGWVHAILLSAN